jgi:hypothetical protein
MPKPETQFLFWDESAGATLHDGRVTIFVSMAVNLAQFVPCGKLILPRQKAEALRCALTKALMDEY